MRSPILRSRSMSPRMRCAAVFVCIGLCLVAVTVWVKVPAAQEKSFLWRVQTDRSTTYLLGSIHFLRKENYPLKKIIEESFSKAARLVFEIDIGSSAGEQIQRLMLQNGLVGGGTTLEQSISAETYGMVGDRAKELGLEPGALQLFKPWLAALTIQSVKLQRLGFDHHWGVDRYLAGRAEKARKPISGLETAESQIALFNGLSAGDQELLLRHTLKQLDLLDQGVDRIVQSWSAGDVVALESLLLATMRDHPELYDKLVVERHRRWLPRIEEIIAQKEPAMIVVGAAHLVGQDGLVALLRARGYKVEQL